MAQNVGDLYLSLRNQKALVTDASSGIGEACAVALAAAGAAVTVNYVSRAEEAGRVVGRIRDQGGEAIAIKADVSREDEVQTMFAEMIGAYGTIDILINNAGLQQDAAFHEMTLKQWNAVISVNLTGQFLCAREAAREFLRRGVVSFGLQRCTLACLGRVRLCDRNDAFRRRRITFYLGFANLG